MRSLTHVRNACVCLVLLLSVPLHAQTLPPPPPTVVEAVKSCNDLAYAYAKNTVAYWEGLPYASDPLYFYKRMCGWQAEGGPDQAPFGLYAVPPSPWHVATADPVIPIPPSTAHELDGQIEQALTLIQHLEIRIAALEHAPSLMAEIEALRAQVVTATAHPIPTQCKAAVVGIPISCKLVP